MPRMSGPKLVEHLRWLDPDQACRVIVLTANPDTPMAARLASHYVVQKPFKVRELRELIDRVSAAARNGFSPTVGSPVATRRA
jgi:FixJ family two-component response regulator